MVLRRGTAIVSLRLHCLVKLVLSTSHLATVSNLRAVVHLIVLFLDADDVLGVWGISGHWLVTSRVAKGALGALACGLFLGRPFPL